MARQILIAGGYPHHLPEAVIKAFRKAGWRAEFFDLSPESPWHRPVVKPVRKLIHNLRIKRHPETFDQTIISNLGWRSNRWWKRMQKLRPDAALILRGNRIALPQLKAAAAAGFPLFCWQLEPISRLSSFLLEAEAHVYREIFVYAQGYLGELEKIGSSAIYYPHRAMELPPEDAVINSNRRYQWSFLGSHSPRRESFLRAVATEFPRGYLQGPRWPRLKNDPLLGRMIHHAYFGQKECVELYLKTRVGLDISSEPNSESSGLAMRIPELLACGCKVMLQPSLEIEALPWSAGSRLDFYRSPEELVTQMRHALAAGPSQSASEETITLARTVVGHRDMVDHINRALAPV